MTNSTTSSLSYQRFHTRLSTIQQLLSEHKTTHLSPKELRAIIHWIKQQESKYQNKIGWMNPKHPLRYIWTTFRTKNSVDDVIQHLEHMVHEKQMIRSNGKQDKKEKHVENSAETPFCLITRNKQSLYDYFEQMPYRPNTQTPQEYVSKNYIITRPITLDGYDVFVDSKHHLYDINTLQLIGQICHGQVQWKNDRNKIS